MADSCVMTDVLYLPFKKSCLLKDLLLASNLCLVIAALEFTLVLKGSELHI